MQNQGSEHVYDFPLRNGIIHNSCQLGNQRGMLIMNMVIIFMLLGVMAVAGMKLYGSMVARGKITDTKSGLDRAVNAIVSWSAANGRIPDTTAPTSFATIIPNPKDAWGKDIVYLYASELTTAGSLCGRTTTASTYSGVPVAFVLLSGGDDFTVNSTLNTSGALPSGDISAKLSSSDLFRVVTLEELKSMAGCYGPTGGRLTILNNELPNVCAGSITYSANLFAAGGVPPYTWSLTTAPSGLTINSSSGALTLSSALYSDISVTASLVDSQSTTLQRTYNLKVSNTGVCATSINFSQSQPAADFTDTSKWNFVRTSTNAMQFSVVNSENMLNFGNSTNSAACAWYSDIYALSGKRLGAFWNFCFNDVDNSSTSASYGHGYTFTIMQGSNPVTLCGSSGEGIGYWGLSGKSIAVEFDTYFSSSTHNDPAYNHVAIVNNGNNTHSIASSNPACGTCNGTNNGTNIANSTACQYDSICAAVSHPVTWLEDGCNTNKDNHSAWVEIDTRCNSDCSVCNTDTCSANPYSYVKVWIDKVSVTGSCTGTCTDSAGATTNKTNQTCDGVCSGTCNGVVIDDTKFGGGTCYNWYPTATAPDLTYCTSLDTNLNQIIFGFTQGTDTKLQNAYISNADLGTYGKCLSPIITPSSLTDGSVSMRYAIQFDVAPFDDGTLPPTPYTWTVSNLPAGLTFANSGESCTDDNSGDTYTCTSDSPCICGSPTTSGTFNNIIVSLSDSCTTDGCTNTSTQALSINVQPAPVYNYYVFNRTGANLFYKNSSNVCTRISNGASYSMLSTDSAKTFYYSTSSKTSRGCSSSTTISVSGASAVTADANIDRKVQISKPSSSLQLSDYLFCASSNYSVYNTGSSSRAYKIGTWCHVVASGSEITDATHKLTSSSGNISRYSSGSTSCTGSSTSSISFTTAVTADANGNCSVNNASSSTLTDR